MNLSTVSKAIAGAPCYTEIAGRLGRRRAHYFATCSEITSASTDIFSHRRFVASSTALTGASSPLSLKDTAPMSCSSACPRRESRTTAMVTRHEPRVALPRWLREKKQPSGTVVLSASSVARAYACRTAGLSEVSVNAVPVTRLPAGVVKDTRATYGRPISSLADSICSLIRIGTPLLRNIVACAQRRQAPTQPFVRRGVRLCRATGIPGEEVNTMRRTTLVALVAAGFLLASATASVAGKAEPDVVRCHTRVP